MSRPGSNRFNRLYSTEVSKRSSAVINKSDFARLKDFWEKSTIIDQPLISAASKPWLEDKRDDQLTSTVTENEEKLKDMEDLKFFRDLKSEVEMLSKGISEAEISTSLPSLVQTTSTRSLEETVIVGDDETKLNEERSSSQCELDTGILSTLSDDPCPGKSLWLNWPALHQNKLNQGLYRILVSNFGLPHMQIKTCPNLRKVDNTIYAGVHQQGAKAEYKTC